MSEQHIKLLLVDDDPMIWDLYEKAFRLMGHDIEVAVNGEEAIAKLNTMDRLPTLVLLDVMMPKVKGLDVLRYIKSTDRLKYIIVVLLTNLPDNKNIQEALKLGALRYLIKQDYTPRQVVEQIEEIMADQMRLK